LGNRGNEISICAIILLSVALLFFPVQQGYGVSTPSPELNERQLIELYELEQLVKAEQARDENFALLIQQNPYLVELPNAIISFKENNEEKSLDLRNENFQLIKDEQIAIAEKKYKEILGGKTISNSFDNESINKKSTLKFEIGDEIGFMKKKSDDFEKYRLLQILIAEDYRNNNWKEHHWGSNPYQNNESSLSDKSHTVTTDEIHTVTTDEIRVVDTDEIRVVDTDFLPNQILTFRIASNNSEIKIKVQTEEVQQLLDGISTTTTVSLVNQVTGTDGIGIISPSKAIKRIFAIQMLPNNDENQILNTPLKNIHSEENQILNTPLKNIHSEENQILNTPLKDKYSEEFKNLIAAQVSLAENTRNAMPEFRTAGDSNPYLNENIDESFDKTNKNDITTNLTDLTFELEFSVLDRETKEFEIVKATELEIAQATLNEMLLLSNSEEDAEIIVVTNENEEINNYSLDAQDFEISKNEQIAIAEKKLMEILGQRSIHNSQFLSTE